MLTIISSSSSHRSEGKRHYPSSDSLGALVQGMSRPALDSYLVPVSSAPSVVPRLPDTVRHFLSVHEKMAGSVPRDAQERSFRGVPSGRQVSKIGWYDPDSDAFIGAHHPPGHRRPASVTLLARVESGGSLSTVVSDLGYPVPEHRPSVVIGGVDRTEGLTLVYAPGPSGLAELTYRIMKASSARYVAITVERPPEPRFEELVDCYRRVFASDRSLVYEDREGVRTGEAREVSLDQSTPAVFQQLG